jgi:putative FmdB family regulatory protein
MRFDYKCATCGGFELDFPIGKAVRSAPCPKCGKDGKRIYTSCNFVLSGIGWPSKGLSFNAEMTKRNEAAGKRQRGRKPGLRLAAYDYGGGDVREVKAK